MYRQLCALVLFASLVGCNEDPQIINQQKVIDSGKLNPDEIANTPYETRSHHGNDETFVANSHAADSTNTPGEHNKDELDQEILVQQTGDYEEQENAEFDQLYLHEQKAQNDAYREEMDETKQLPSPQIDLQARPVQPIQQEVLSSLSLQSGDAVLTAQSRFSHFKVKTQEKGQILTGDFDGDSRLDFLFVSHEKSEKNRVYLSKTKSSVDVKNSLFLQEHEIASKDKGTAQLWLDGVGEQRFFVGDFDGNGQSDVLRVIPGDGQENAIFSFASGFQTVGEKKTRAPMQLVQQNLAIARGKPLILRDHDDYLDFYLEDLNRDGKTDIFVSPGRLGITDEKTQEPYRDMIYFAQGSLGNIEFKELKQVSANLGSTLIPVKTEKNMPLQFADFNGDGLKEIITLNMSASSIANNHSAFNLHYFASCDVHECKLRMKFHNVFGHSSHTDPFTFTQGTGRSFAKKDMAYFLGDFDGNGSQDIFISSRDERLMPNRMLLSERKAQPGEVKFRQISSAALEAPRTLLKNERLADIRNKIQVEVADVNGDACHDLVRMSAYDHDKIPVQENPTVDNRLWVSDCQGAWIDQGRLLSAGYGVSLFATGLLANQFSRKTLLVDFDQDGALDFLTIHNP